LARIPQSFAARQAAAGWIVERSRVRGVDPFLVVALIDHESRWNAYAVNSRSGTRGLAQIDPRFYDGDPDDLFGVEVNVRQIVGMLAAARLYCAPYSSRASDWLQVTTGWDAVRGSRCGFRCGRHLPVPPMVLDILRAARH
jgi:hypothetical protein